MTAPILKPLSQVNHKLSWLQAYFTAVTIEIKGAELNSWLKWITALVNPISYLGLLGVGLASQLGDKDYLTFIIPGVIVMQSIGLMTKLIYRTVIERRWGLSALKLQAGMPKSAYLFALLTPPLLIFLLQGITVVAFVIILGVNINIFSSLLAVLAALIAAIFWNILGIIITGIISDYRTRDFLVGLIITPLTFAAPVFYSLNNTPKLLRIISLINPLTYQV